MTAVRTGRPGGLSGLLRLRSLRERDSRTGLATALGEERDAAARLADLEHLVATLPTPQTWDLPAFQGRQHTLELIRVAIGTARSDLETAQHVSAAARDRWISDRTRLKAVESLIERRAAAARAEQRRREVRELDEVAAQLWRRRRLTPVVDGGAR